MQSRFGTANASIFPKLPVRILITGNFIKNDLYNILIFAFYVVFVSKICYYKYKLLFNRQREHERRSFAHFTLCPYLSTV